MIYHYLHVGDARTAARLLVAGWQLVADYPPHSPVIEGAWWFRLGPCPARPR